MLESHAGLAGARNFDSAVLYEEAIAIVCSTDHPLSAVDTVTLDMLTQYDWVLPPSTSITGKLIEEEFVSAGLRPPVPKVEWLTSASRLTLVQKSNFLGICPASVAAELQQGGRLHVLPVNPRVPLPPISVVWRCTKGDIAEIMDMKNALIECAAAMPGAMKPGRPPAPANSDPARVRAARYVDSCGNRRVSSASAMNWIWLAFAYASAGALISPMVT